MTSRDAAARVVTAARSITDRQLVVGSLGNVSVRVDDKVLITPTRIPHKALTVEDIVTVDLEGRLLAGRWPPSRETPLHVAVHRQRPDSAVVHTHSTHATAWGLLGVDLPTLTEDLDYYEVGPVRVAPYAPPGSAALAAGVATHLRTSRAVLLASHGVAVVSATLEDAVEIAEVVERQAQLALLVQAHHHTVPSTFSSSPIGRV